MRTNLFLTAFFIVSLIHIVAEGFGWFPLVFWTKILLMPLLLTGMLRGLRTGDISPSIKAAIWALLFSTAGDLFLLYEKTDHQALFFYFGLGSFLLAQISYTIAFIRIGKLAIPLPWVVPYLLYFGGFVLLLKPALPPALLIAVIGYGIALTLMAWNSWRTLYGEDWIRIGGVAGAVLFLISDSLLAINRFKMPITHAGFWIMVTYISAQYLLIRSIIIKSRSNNLLKASTG